MTTATLRPGLRSGAGVVLRRRPLQPLLRLRVWLHREDLLARLAGGASPASAPELAALAGALTALPGRQALATGFANLLYRGIEAPTRDREPTPPNRHEIRATRTELTPLIERLRQPRAAQVRGLAMAELLLCDPCSPLSCPSPEASAWRLVRATREALDAPVR